MSSTTIIGIPTDEKVFERNCVPLFAGLLNDPNVKLVGSRGKKQFGLDLIGRRHRDPTQPVGIQCKLITKGGKLKESVIREEVADALAIKPPLTEYYIVTTASDETSHDLLAIELAQEQAKLGRTIDIQVWGWDTLQEKIRADPRALRAFDPDYSASTAQLLALGNESLEIEHRILARTDQIQESIDLMRSSAAFGPVDTARSAAIEVHLDKQIDDYRDLMNAGKPKTALELLLKLETTLKDNSSLAIRARIKANVAFARLRLNDEAGSAALLAEAYALNPTDPKTKANNILALALSGDLQAAWCFANEVLTQDPSNWGAAAMAFQVAAMSSDLLEPTAIVPVDALDNLDVRIHRISYLRHKGPPESWWQLASETFERFPEDGAAKRIAAEALIDAALSNRAIETSRALTEDRRAKLERGAALLEEHWDTVRHYEDAGHHSWILVGLNLTTAYRALGDADRAQEISEQMLAMGSAEPDVWLAAAQVAIEGDRFAEAVEILEKAPAGTATTMALMVAHSNLNDWPSVLSLATADARAALRPADLQLFDVMRFRARRAADSSFISDHAVEELLESWPLGVAAHIAVADLYLAEKHPGLARMADKAKSLISEGTSYADRVMFAQLSLFRDAWDDIIEVLDGYVSVNKPSEPLAWLAFAFANGATRPRTTRFFKELAADVIALPRYARLAGAAEHNRGDLNAAQTYLRAVISADQHDLRAHLLLNSTLERANRSADAIDLLSNIDDESVDGTPVDLMRLAHLLRRSGEVERALKLGYRIAAGNRDDEALMSSYPGLILFDDDLPDHVGRAGPAGEHFWFDLEGLGGPRDIQGVIDTRSIAGVMTFGPSHPLSIELIGKSVDDVVVIPAEVGEDRRYRVRELKHKYIWLLHDIMASHAVRFPDATSLIELTMQEGDVRAVLDFARDIQERGDVVTRTYLDFPVPLSAVAAMAKKPVLGLAEQLVSSGINLRTCLGALEERQEAAGFVQSARGKGAVFDTLTIWQLRELGHLAAAKAYFGRLCIARSTFDEFLELRAKIEFHRGREFMTLGYEGDQAYRHIHTAEDTEARFAAINAAISDLENYCDMLPVDGTGDTRLENLMGHFAAAQVFDPISLARREGLILVSEDLNLRQFAAQQKVVGGAWLQVVLNVMAASGEISDEAFLVSVGMLGALRHEHVWLDAGTMIGILSLGDEQGFPLFEAAIRFMGGRKAEMQSHINVTVEFACAIWSTSLPDWQKGRALGRLLSQLVNSRPADWKAVLHVLDAELARRSCVERSAARAHTYLVGWIGGHFFDLNDLRSREKLLTDLRTDRSMKAARPSRRKGRMR